MSLKNKLFVGGLSPQATENSLFELFEKFGKIQDACIVYDPTTRRSRGFGYVLFEEASDADAAKETVRGTMVDGKEINVEYANAKDPAREAAKRNRYGDSRGGDRGGYGGRGGGPPRGRGGFRGRGGPPRGGMSYRGRGPPDRRGPPRGYDQGGYGGGYDDGYQSRGGGGYDRDGYSGGGSYGAPRRDSYDSYPPPRDGPRRDGPPPRRDPPADGGYGSYPGSDRERYPPSDRGRPANSGGGGGDRYQPEASSYGNDDYNNAPASDRYGGPPASQQRSYGGRDW